jgi:hypothetical protein
MWPAPAFNRAWLADAFGHLTVDSAAGPHGHNNDPAAIQCYYLLADAYRKLGRRAEADVELARFQELARTKSAQRNAMARELVTSRPQGADESLDLEPGFSPSRHPVHP